MLTQKLSTAMMSKHSAIQILYVSHYSLRCTVTQARDTGWDITVTQALKNGDKMASSSSNGELKQVRGVSHTRTDSHDDRGHMSSREIHMDEGWVYYRAVMLMGVCALNCQRTLMQNPQERGKMTKYLYLHMENNVNLFWVQVQF